MGLNSRIVKMFSEWSDTTNLQVEIKRLEALSSDLCLIATLIEIWGGTVLFREGHKNLSRTGVLKSRDVKKKFLTIKNLNV